LIAPGAVSSSGLEVAFHAVGSGRVLAFTHAAERPSGGAVVICSPIGNEQIQNHSRELELARVLAGAGVVVRRFHFRGAGDSDGRADEMTLESMREDAVATARELLERPDVDRLAFVGTRFASLVAAAAARELDAAALALWEPVVQPPAYFEEIFRYELIHELIHGKRSSPQDVRSLKQELASRQFADVLGFPLARALYEQAADYNLAEQLSALARPTLLIQVRRLPGLAEEYAALAPALARQGVELETRLLRGNIPWWFLSRPDRTRVEDRELIEATSSWLTERLVRGR
jgi:alpha/beta superfamily hydrolase